MPATENHAHWMRGRGQILQVALSFRMASCRWVAGVAVLLSLLAGCTHPTDRRRYISRSLQQRTGEAPGDRDPASLQPSVPPDIDLNRPITMDEAVAIALWNNADFQVALAELGFTRAEVIRAGQLTNPTFSILFPVGPKQLEFAAKFPVEAIWLRPRRIAIAEDQAAALAERLVAGGLDLVRDVRLAACELDLARERLKVLEESLRIRREIGHLTEARVAAGDVSELEAVQSRADVARAAGEQVRLQRDFNLAEQRLRGLMGLGSAEVPFQLQALPVPEDDAWDSVVTAGGDEAAGAPPVDGSRNEKERLAVYQRAAFAARPELRAAELELEAAGRQVGLTKAELFTLSAIVDANGSGSDFEIGPGLEMPLPILHQNQAARALADARVARAARQYVAVRERVLAEVSAARTRMTSAREERHAWEGTLAALETAARQARKARELGELSRLATLELDRAELDARMQGRLVQSDYRRALIELERAVGHGYGPWYSDNAP
ncbi:MAG: TolC family protein [Verrucomicrobiales bacterium]|nr:TolC family protein [Verrucomicrobiales bacterium]